ncbi:MAG: 3-phosphoshikimate 1-carboxyvinyltransferase [Nitrospiraceae bacterium]|nr:3-phosphoshikimate 1-carboxyvinyltransferase [Nitrospiraceae bacterium]
MNLQCEPSVLRGAVDIPGSKSHTIRAVAIGALAGGESLIRRPLDSEDSRSSVAAYRALGADIITESDTWLIRGIGGCPRTPADVIDVGNSGTSLNVALGSSALMTEGVAVFTGDEQIRRRPEGPLIAALNDLGAKVRSTRGNGCPPITVEGTLRGGETTIEAQNSQFLTSLLINAPLAESDTRILAPVLSERPYVEMTLEWLSHQGVTVEHNEDLSEFHVPGGQAYEPVDSEVPGDFSSATFFLAAGALGDNDIDCIGLDLSDTQGDRAVIDYLHQMGAEVHVDDDCVRVSGGTLKGCSIDLNATPDALPMMAVLGCFAQGTTRLENVPQARIKETDRIAVMKAELERLGARVEELEDGLVVHEGALTGAEVDGHGDHRVVMALAVAGTVASGRTTIRGYEAVAVTFPTFVESMARLGGALEVVE